MKSEGFGPDPFMFGPVSINLFVRPLFGPTSMSVDADELYCAVKTGIQRPDMPGLPFLYNDNDTTEAQRSSTVVSSRTSRLTA